MRLRAVDRSYKSAGRGRKSVKCSPMHSARVSCSSRHAGAKAPHLCFKTYFRLFTSYAAAVLRAPVCESVCLLDRWKAHDADARCACALTSWAPLPENCRPAKNAKPLQQTSAQRLGSEGSRRLRGGPPFSLSGRIT